MIGSGHEHHKKFRVRSLSATLDFLNTTQVDRVSLDGHLTVPAPSDHCDARDLPQQMVSYIHSSATDQTDIMNMIDQQTAYPVHTDPSNKRYDLSDRDLVHGYAEMITDRIRDGWSCSLLTFLFPHFPGSRPTVLDRMKDEIQRFYSTLVTRTHRKPRTASPDELPLLIAVADLPVYKRDKTSSPMVLCNGGLHFHGLLLVPPTCRLKESVDEHVQNRRDLYLRGFADLHVRLVTDGYDRVVDYLFKTVLRGRVSYDEGTLLLPRTTREVVSV